MVLYRVERAERAEIVIFGRSGIFLCMFLLVLSKVGCRTDDVCFFFAIRVGSPSVELSLSRPLFFSSHCAF